MNAVFIALFGLTKIAGAVMARAVFLAIFAVLGVTSSLALAPIRTVIQTTTPAHSIGRVTALSEALNTCALLTAPFAGAALAAATTLGAVRGGDMDHGYGRFLSRANPPRGNVRFD